MSCYINNQNYQHPTLSSLFIEQQDYSVFVEMHPRCYSRNLIVSPLNL